MSALFPVRLVSKSVSERRGAGRRRWCLDFLYVQLSFRVQRTPRRAYDTVGSCTERWWRVAVLVQAAILFEVGFDVGGLREVLSSGRVARARRFEYNELAMLTARVEGR